MLVLASNSPRRRQLLELDGWSYQVIPAEIDEQPQAGELAPDYVLRLARDKAAAVAHFAPPDAIILAADTAVSLGDRILGKPADAAEALSMIRSLRGRTHQVYTGLAVLHPSQDRLLQELCVTDVLMRDYAEAEIRAYVDSGDPLDKAGAYAIQHRGFNPVEKVVGCYANVMGLPLCTLTGLLREFGLRTPRDITAGCRTASGIQCKVEDLI